MKKKQKFINNVPDIQINGLWLKTYSENTEDLYICYKTRSCVLWYSINQRTKSSEYMKIKNPTYIESNNLFEDYQEFTEWCNSTHGYMNIDSNGKFWAIDKDILSFGECKDYSKDNCIFVPNHINNIFTFRTNHRGDFPLGVHISRESGGFLAHCKGEYLGFYNNSIDAHRAWQRAKIESILYSALDQELGVKLQNALNRCAEKIKRDYDNGIETKW